MLGLVWVNGNLVEPQDASVSIADHGLTVGDGAFETCTVRNGIAFALGRHLRRLRRSLDGLAITGLPDDEELRDAVAQVVSSAPDAGRLRITVTDGDGPLGSGRAPGPPTVVIAAAETAAQQAHASVHIVPWVRNERGALAGLKTTSYAENVVALRAAQDNGADEAIFANTIGNLCEGTGTNVFVVLDGRLMTPPLSSGCLAGVTRELIIELTNAVECDLPMSAFQAADEAFLTSSTRDVHPIGEIDGRALPATPGKTTVEAAAAFADLMANTSDP